jgi:hypothetical protein
VYAACLSQSLQTAPLLILAFWAVHPTLTCVWSFMQRWLTKRFSLLKMDQESGTARL